MKHVHLTKHVQLINETCTIYETEGVAMEFSFPARIPPKF